MATATATDFTTCSFPALPLTVKTYKSQRAATMSLNKAQKAYEAALSNRCKDEFRRDARDADLWKRTYDLISSTWANLSATADSVKAQGFCAGSF